MKDNDKIVVGNRMIDILQGLKHWDLVDVITNSHYYLSSKNGILIACLVAPHEGNHWHWLVRVANFRTFDRWSFAEVQEELGTFEGAVDFLTMIDVDKELVDPLGDMEDEDE